MSDGASNDGVLKLLRLLGERLASYLEGDESALETLAESIEQGGFGSDEIQGAVTFLEGLGAAGFATTLLNGDSMPGQHVQRVLSDQERDSLSPEAWGFLLDLRRRGSLGADDVERVLDILSACGVRPVGVELAREVAARVALKFDETDGLGEIPHGDVELSH